MLLCLEEYMNNFRNLDFSSLPCIDSMDIWSRLDRDCEKLLTEDGPLFEVNERTRAALMFFCGVNDKNEGLKNSAYLRAGLNEFYSIEDAAKRDFSKSKLDENAPKISSSKNPLLHLMLILRHVNVHAMVSSTDIYNTSVISKFKDQEEHAWGAVVLSSPTLDDLLKSNQANKYYCSIELEKAAKWLDEIQYVFGVGEVFRRGLSIYLRQILQLTKLSA